MKTLGLLTIILGLTLFSCKHRNGITAKTENRIENIKENEVSKDKEEIQNLIRQVLNWAGSKNSIDLLPVITDRKDSIYIGFDIKKHKLNLEQLKATNFFSTEFIDNYNQIILTLDRKLRNGEFEQWLVGDLPTFIFANDINPWTLCQDVAYDKPNPWDYIEVEVMQLNKYKGELDWKWGKLELNADTSWKDFKYRFRVVKENDKWKIAYLQGFDFKESTRKDGL